jgi:hypothetical protein
MIHANTPKNPVVKKVEITKEELLLDMPFDKYIKMTGGLKRMKKQEKPNDKDIKKEGL